MNLLKMVWNLFRSHTHGLERLQIEDLKPAAQYVPSTMPPLPWVVTLHRDSAIYTDGFQDQVLDGDWIGYEYSSDNWGFFGSVHDTLSN